MEWEQIQLMTSATSNLKYIHKRCDMLLIKKKSPLLQKPNIHEQADHIRKFANPANNGYNAVVVNLIFSLKVKYHRIVRIFDDIDCIYTWVHMKGVQLSPQDH